MPASPAQRGWCLTEVSEQTLAAYDAPFPTQEFAVGARRFPMLVPITVDDPERLEGDAAWEVLGSFTKPVLTLWGDHCQHTYTEQGEQFRAGIPGTRSPGIEHKVFRASHYIQEDLGPRVCVWYPSERPAQEPRRVQRLHGKEVGRPWCNQTGRPAGRTFSGRARRDDPRRLSFPLADVFGCRAARSAQQSYQLQDLRCA